MNDKTPFEQALDEVDRRITAYFKLGNESYTLASQTRTRIDELISLRSFLQKLREGRG